MVKIYFLGTSHGIAEKGRFRTSMLLEIEEHFYLFDLGAPIGTIMKNHDMDFMKVKAAFVTHMHSDHAIDIPEYMELCCWCDGERYLYLPEGKENAEKWNYALHGEELYESGGCRIETVKEGMFYDDGSITVEAIPTKHLKRGISYAYEVCAGEKRILFTGDLTDSFSDFPDTGRQYDAVICELTHFDVENALDTLNGVNSQIIIFNHVRDDKIKMLNDCADKVMFNYHITNDGDIMLI